MTKTEFIPKLFSKKGIVAICAAVVLLIGLPVGIAYALGQGEKFDGNLRIDVQESVTLSLNSTVEIPCKISYSKAVCTVESSNLAIFTVKENNIQDGYLELESYNEEGKSETLTITAQYGTSKAEASVAVVVADENDDSDGDTETPQTDDGEKTLDSLTSGAVEDSSGEYILVDDNEYFSTKMISVSGSVNTMLEISGSASNVTISGVYLVAADGSATLKEPSFLAGGTGTVGTYQFDLTHKRLSLLILADVDGTTYFVKYSLT